MRGEMLRFVLENDLNPFNSVKSLVKMNGSSIYKTRDAKMIHNKVLGSISSGFVFNETSNLWNVFGFTSDVNEVNRRQEFFKSLSIGDNSFLSELKKPRANWKPQYDVVVVTEDESTFIKLRELGCGVHLLVSESDVSDLERYDVVQVVDCEDFGILLERLPQSVFLDSVDDVYLERYLEELSGWSDNFLVLSKFNVSGDINILLKKLKPMFNLLDNKKGRIITEGEVEKIVEGVNETIGAKIKEMMISGEAMMKMLSEGKIPADILAIVREAIGASGLSEHIFNLGIPVTIDYKELGDQIKKQSATEFTDLAERVKMASEDIKSIPKILNKLSALILLEDFCSGVSQWISQNKSFPTHSANLTFIDAVNMFLGKAQPISFQLDNFSRCSILTGANSGGKTTLLEHILQNVSLYQLGLPVIGEVHMPMFNDVYYFAKTKGSGSKGAFETLLTQMSKVGNRSSIVDSQDGKTLILADEIEAVTEPGVAGKIISATADYFIRKNYFMIFATHLGVEVAKILPEGARVDGIEAKGLDENFNLIVDHNPVLGRLAHSTPELIIERMANNFNSEYFEFLFKAMKE